MRTGFDARVQRLLLIGVCVVACALGSNAGAATVNIESRSAALDGEFFVDVSVSSVTDVYGVAFDIVFDPLSLEVVDADPGTDGIQPFAAEGGILNEGGGVLSASLAALEDGGQGRLVVGLSRLGGVSGATVAGGEVLVSFKFRSLSEGAASLSIENNAAMDSTGADLPLDTWNDGTVTSVSGLDSGLDEDGDGLTNGEETALGTDPFDSDSDRDSLPDDWETDNSLDPLADDSEGDPDGDGYSNYDEYLGGSDPQDSNDIPAASLTITDVSPNAALVVGGCPITIYGALLNGGVRIFVNDVECANVTYDSGLDTLSGTVPPSVEGAAVVRVEDPANSDADTYRGSYAYTTDPFSMALDMTEGVARSWTENGVTVSHGYLSNSSALQFSTPEGIEISIPTALGAGYMDAFFIVRSASGMAGLYPSETIVFPADYAAATGVFDIGGLLYDGATTFEIDDPFASPVAVVYPVTVGDAADVTNLGLIETHLDEVLAPFFAIPDVDPVIEMGSAPTAVDSGAQTVTFDVFDFTTYLGLLLEDTGVPGDVNGDGAVNASDIQLVINAALGIEIAYDADVNSDGSINASDVQLVINAALGIDISGSV